jgi:hypothetical protein
MNVDPMVRRRVICTVAEAEAMHAKLVESAARTAKWLAAYSGEPMALLRSLRFETVGGDPLTGVPLNIIEQLNQTFTIIVTLHAIERLIELHPDGRLMPGRKNQPPPDLRYFDQPR